MINRITANRRLLLSYYLFLGVGLLLIIFYSKAELFHIFHFRGGMAGDLIFRGITFLGDGLFAFILVILIGLIKIRYSIYLLITFAFSGIIVQLMKRLIFPDALRPLLYFERIGINLEEISGYENHFYYSFPSGYTATAFAIFFGIAFIIYR